jgi:hypothetical protein
VTIHDVRVRDWAIILTFGVLLWAALMAGILALVRLAW